MKTDPAKPRMRGFVHAFAFVCTAASSAVFAASSLVYRFDLGIFIYLLGQLFLYGASAFYHIPTWGPEVESALQHLDHMCIFVLISTTQTSVLMSLVDLGESPVARLVIRLSWSITLVGILKIAVTRRFHKTTDLFFYIAHGLVVLPFCKILLGTSTTEKALVAAGAVLYIVGGAVYGLQRPDPFPRLFGYHEIFHVFTIAANMCFAVIIAREYVLSASLQCYTWCTAK